MPESARRERLIRTDSILQGLWRWRFDPQGARLPALAGPLPHRRASSARRSGAPESGTAPGAQNRSDRSPTSFSVMRMAITVMTMLTVATAAAVGSNSQRT